MRGVLKVGCVEVEKKKKKWLAAVHSEIAGRTRYPCKIYALLRRLTCVVAVIVAGVVLGGVVVMVEVQ
jgi:hypothetical protein